MDNINTVISKYLGVPYKFQGTSIKDGLDCANLCTLVGTDFGILTPNINHMFCTNEDYYLLFNTVISNQKLWIETPPAFGTICAFKINGVVKHAGFMLNDYDFIHIMENSKVTIDSIDSIQWARRLVGCYKYIGKDLEI